MRIVEFCGVRAVGKTTMKHHLLRTRPALFVDAAIEDPETFDETGRHFPEFGEFEEFIREVCARHKTNPRKLPRTYIRTLTEYTRMRARVDDRIALFDQGLVQHCRGFSILTRSPPLVEAYLRLVPLPAVAVLFHVSEETAVKRNLVRDSKIKPGHLPIMFQTLETIRTALPSRGCHVVDLDGERSIGDKAEAIVEALT
jgi:hypothetical protein